MRNRLVYAFLSSLFASFARCFRLPFVKKAKEACLATELDRARGSNLEDSSLAAVIENYFEGRVEPVEAPRQGQGQRKTTLSLSLHWSAPAGAYFPNWEN